METDDREKRKSGKPKQEACDDLECYHRFPEHIIFRDMQRDSAPDEALRKSCVWSKICVVRGKYKISTHSDLWIDLCRRREAIIYRTGWFTPLVHRDPLVEALRDMPRERRTETKADLNAKLAVKELTR